MINKYIGISLFTACLIVSGCADDNSVPNDDLSNVETAENNPEVTNPDVDNSTNSDPVNVRPNNSTDWGNSVMAIIAAQPDLEKFEAAVLAAEGYLAETLNDPNNRWTVFAPSDEAMGDVQLDRDGVLKYISSGTLRSPNLRGMVGSELPMTDSSSQLLSVAENGVTLVVGGATVYQNDITGDNGVVHKIITLLP